MAAVRFVQEALLSPLPPRPGDPEARGGGRGEAKGNDDLEALMAIGKCAVMFALGAFQLATFNEACPSPRAAGPPSHVPWI